jgi:xylulokinase
VSGPLVVGIDVSTNAAKALVVDELGRTLATASASFETHAPGGGAFEQDAEDWWRALQEVLATTARALGPEDAPRVCALSIAHQRETFVVCDSDGAPLHPGIVWMDERAKQEVDEVVGELGRDAITELSGKPPCVTPSLYKIRMVLARLAPELARRQDLRVADVGGFLIRRLTGAHRTSLASADPLGLCDMRRRTLSAELCGAARVVPSSLPELAEPGTDLGALLPDVARRLGLAPTVRVVAGAGDGQAAALGVGVVRDDQLYLNLGTAIVGGALSSEYRTGRAFRTLFAAQGGFLLEMDLKGGTLSLDWLVHRVLGRPRERRAAVLADLEREARTIPPGSEGLLFVPYLAGVMNPHWDDDLGGAFLGLRADHGPAHLYRAILEGLALEQRLATDALVREIGPRPEVRVTGGASHGDLALQIFADVLRTPLARCTVHEATALGAAMLAAAATGLVSSPSHAARTWPHMDPAVEPGPNASPYGALVDTYNEAQTALLPTLATLGRSRRVNHT